MTLYQVAEVEDGELYYTEAFADCGVDLEGLSQEEGQDAAELLAVYAGYAFAKRQKPHKYGIFSC